MDSGECFYLFTLHSPLITLHLTCEQYVLVIGGDERDRTADPLLARQVLSQLSYTPTTDGIVE